MKNLNIIFIVFLIFICNSVNAQSFTINLNNGYSSVCKLQIVKIENDIKCKIDINDIKNAMTGKYEFTLKENIFNTYNFSNFKDTIKVVSYDGNEYNIISGLFENIEGVMKFYYIGLWSNSYEYKSIKCLIKKIQKETNDKKLKSYLRNLNKYV